jgi:NTE family protein
VIHVALVLGAGGSPGSAFHAGVVAGLAEATGWDAREAELVVGTSAGANTAATLRAGLSPADHLARVTGAPLSEEGTRLVERVRTGLRLGPGTPTRAVRPPASARLIVEGLLGPGPFRPGVTLAGALPRGALSTASIAARVREAHPDPWPEQPTWVCALSVRTGRRIVFGRDDVEVDHLGTAVAASSAVPGSFAPVRIGGVDYLDGAVHSTTNADLVSGLGFDVVVVSAPMARQGPSGRLPRSQRSWHARVLERELRGVRSTAAVIAVAPPLEDLHLMEAGGDTAAVARLGRRLALESLESTGEPSARRLLEQAGSPQVADRP